MDSGIYVLDFSDGTYYIGKSDNIPNRWRQHWKDFESGTHARRMQDAYNRCGPPRASVFIKCHSDHIDLYESLAIHHNWGPKCLNGNKPRRVPDQEKAILLESGQYIELSTAQHIELLNKANQEVEQKEKEIKGLAWELKELQNRGIRTPEGHRQELEHLKSDLRIRDQEIDIQKRELSRLAKLSIWDRIFNYKVYV